MTCPVACGDRTNSCDRIFWRPLASALLSQKGCDIGERASATRTNLPDTDFVVRQIARIHVPRDGLGIDIERGGELSLVEKTFPLEGETHFIR